MASLQSFIAFHYMQIYYKCSFLMGIAFKQFGYFLLYCVNVYLFLLCTVWCVFFCCFIALHIHAINCGLKSVR